MTILTVATLITMALFGSSTDSLLMETKNYPITEASYVERIRAERLREEQRRVASLVTNHFKDTPSLVAVAQCESSMRHFTPDGEVLRGDIDRRDVGIMQINEYYHGKQATDLGYNIYTLEGNMNYAKYLYEIQGLSPWGASKNCWEKYL